MRYLRALIAVMLGLGWLGLSPPPPALWAQSPPGVAAFADGFETDTGWKVFEELVSGSPCYARGLGVVERTSALAFAGQQSLSVWANARRGDKSNHLIAYTALVPADARGLWRYRVRVAIPPASAGFGQTGPELSIQNTRPGPGGAWTTAIAGVQYIANPYLGDVGGWHLWAETAPGSASWRDIALAPINPGQWYTATLDVDYGANRYIGFGLAGPASNLRVPLHGYRVAEEAKGFVEPSFVLTLESENLWNNCEPGLAFDYQVLYDQVEAYMLYQLALPIIHAGP